MSTTGEAGLDPRRWEEALRAAELPDPSGAGTVLPSRDGRSIAAVPRLIEAAFGARAIADDPLSTAWPSRAPLPARRVLLLIIDGLGYLRLRALMDEFPDLYLGQLAERGHLLPLTAVCPATTVSAVATLSTAAAPAQHGLLGYRLYLREIAAVTNMIRLSIHGNAEADTAITLGIEPDRFLGTSTAFERLAEQDVISDVLMARQIAGSGLSKLLYRGASKVHGVTTFSDALITARELLAGEAPRFVTLYWGSLDGVGHVYGPFSERFTAELRALDAILRQQLEGNLLDATLLVAADHGMVEMADRDYLTLEDLPPLGGALRLPPVGEPRATYAFLDRGRVEEVREALCAREDLEFAVLRSEEALALGLFGDGAPHPEAAARLGDLVLVSTGRRGLYHAYPDAARLRGMHGGLTDHEMLVPLLIAAI
jgi:predicted AlkP superfamily pyrophosphatase or phosphodiesterase